MNLGDGIKHLREARRLSARALSLKCGFSPSYVSKIESGEIEPGFWAFARLAIVLEMTTQEILFLVEEEAKKPKEKLHAVD